MEQVHLLELKAEVYEMLSKEMRELIQENNRFLGKLGELTGMFGLFLEIADVELLEKTLVDTVRLCQYIKMQDKLMKKRLESMEEMLKSVTESIPDSDNKLMESHVNVFKKPIKEIEEVSLECGDILERLDKPASLLELGLARVQGLGFIQLGASSDQLPVTLKTQVGHWPTTRQAGIREKVEFLVQALGRLVDIASRS